MAAFFFCFGRMGALLFGGGLPRALLEHTPFFSPLLRCLVLFDSSTPPCRVNYDSTRLDSTRRPPKAIGRSSCSLSFPSVGLTRPLFFSWSLSCLIVQLVIIERRVDICSVLFCLFPALCSLVFSPVFLLALWPPSVNTAWNGPCSLIFFLFFRSLLST